MILTRPRPGRFPLAALGAWLVLLGTLRPLAAEQAKNPAAQCQPDGPLATMPELAEASGLALSQRLQGRLWAHNDSGQPVVFALDTRGAVTARVRLTGAVVEDWEAMAVARCPAGSCLYIADIGDNNRSRKRVTVYRVPEPAGSVDSVAVSDTFHATYPDAAHDAETLLVTPDGALFIVTKGSPGAGALYRFPGELKSGATHTLEMVGQPRPAAASAKNERITDGAVSADGAWVVLRTNRRLAFYRSADILKGNWREEKTADITTLREAQGEGVAFGPGGSLYLAGEGGGKSRPGSLAHLICTLDR